jgi:hypothetical protein
VVNNGLTHFQRVPIRRCSVKRTAPATTARLLRAFDVVAVQSLVAADREAFENRKRQDSDCDRQYDVLIFLR